MSDTKLLITIDNQILLGCYDMISVFGGDPEGMIAEKIVSDVLTSLILGMKDDRLIPIYETETEILTQLEKHFPDLKSSVLGKIEDMAANLQKTIEDGDSFSVKEDIDPTVVDNLQIENEESTTGEVKVLTFSELPEKDILVIESKGDSRKEESLTEVYTIISRDMWGTSSARKMWELILSKKEVPAVSDEDADKKDATETG